MKNKLFYYLVLLLCGSFAVHAQDSTISIPGSCALNGKYMQSMGVTSPGHGATAAFIIPALFPASAKDTCGKFIVYYEDLQPGAPVGGFSAGGGLGAARRNTMCQVLNYIQSVFYFGNIPPGQFIRLHVDTSYSFPSKPVPVGSVLEFSHGVCAPFYNKSAAIGGAILNGFVYDWIRTTTGVDPNPGDYHANLKMNFEKITRGIYDVSRSLAPLTPALLNYNSEMDSAANCEYDLGSILLHMVSHTMGWFSWQDTGSRHLILSSGLPMSHYDTSMGIIKDPKTATDPFGSIEKFSTFTGGPGLYYLTVNRKKPPYNYFTYGRDPFKGISEYSHLLTVPYAALLHITPGDYYDPVMGTPFLEGRMVREYSKADLLTFRDVIGLVLEPAFAASHTTLLGNRIPYSTRMFSDAYNAILDTPVFAELVNPDYSLTNNTGASLTINLNTDPTLKDDDGDQLSVYPGSLVNFRGCGNGGNNHDQLTLSSDGKTITYTPRANFYGRAQLGFNLYDGKEKGAFVMYTINVLKGTNVTAPKGSNMVLNGDFEEGAELKLPGSPNVNNTATHGPQNPTRTLWSGRLSQGITLSDGHPWDCVTDYIYGTAVRNSYQECSDRLRGAAYGHPASSFPWPWSYAAMSTLGGLLGTAISDGYPDAVAVPGKTNNRYQPMGQDGILMNLADTLKKCRRYVLEFDARRTFRTPRMVAGGTYTYPATDLITLGFTNSVLAGHPATSTYIRKQNFTLPTISFNTWQHFKFSFSFCADTMANVVLLDIAGAWANNETVPTTLLDNVSIIETDLKIAAGITDTASGCQHKLAAGPPALGCPAMSYEWRDPSGTVVSTARTLEVSALDTVVYTVKIADGCTVAYDTITLYPCACAPVRLLGRGYTTLTGTVAASLPPGKYYIPGEITITGTPTFTGMSILTAANAGIRVNNNALLTLDNTHLFTCPDSNDMWRGITLVGSTTSTPSGRIEVKNNSMIEDALFAIDGVNLSSPPSGDLVQVTNSVFNRNQVDISLNNYKPVSPATYPVTILGNLFTSRLINKSNFSGYPFAWPTAASLKKDTAVIDATPAYVIHRRYSKVKCKDTTIFPMVGVRTVDIGYTDAAGTNFSEIVIGGGSSVDDRNLFDNHGYGIMNFRSNLSVYNNVFINISRRIRPDTSTSLPLENGMGILAVNDPALKRRMRVDNLINIPNRFHDCFLGIYAERFSDLLIRNTVMTSSHQAGAPVPGAAYPSETDHSQGILMHGGYNQKNVTIAVNRISNMSNGIGLYLENPAAGAATLLDGNLCYGANPDISAGFTANQYMRNGISGFTPTAFGNANTLTITGNKMYDLRNGIALNGFKVTKANVTNNTIILKDFTASSPEHQFAIRMDNTINATVSTNPISSPVLVSSVNDRRIKGVYAAMNTGLRICNNTTQNIGWSFEFDQWTPQVDTRWISNTMTDSWGGMVLNSDIGEQGFMYNFVTMSPYIFYGATLNKWNGFGGTKVQTIARNFTNTLNSKLYVRNLTGTSAQLPTVNIASPPGPFPYFYQLSGTTGSIRIPTVTQWDANCEGGINMTKPNPFPGPVTGTKTLGSIVLADALGYDTGRDVNQWMAQLSLYELGTVSPDLRDSNAIFDQFMGIAAGSRFGWITSLDAALSINDQSTAQSLLNSPAQAMGRVVINNDLVITDYTAADPIADNYRNVFTAYLHYLQGTMNATDTGNLAVIAAKCPATDGAVVYKARGLYNQVAGRIIAYNDEDCANNGVTTYKIIPAEQTGNNLSYSLFPNPNNGSFTLTRLQNGKGSTSEKEMVGIKVFNALGQLIYQNSANFTNGRLELNIGQKAAGVYLVCIDDEQSKNTCLRFVLK